MGRNAHFERQVIMSGAKNKCQKHFICDCYPNGMVQDCVFKVSSYANWVCDCQAAIGEHIALCNCDAANRAADTKEQNGYNAQQPQVEH